MLGLGLEDQTQVTVQGVLVGSLVRPLAIESEQKKKQNEIYIFGVMNLTLEAGTCSS